MIAEVEARHFDGRRGLLHVRGIAPASLVSASEGLERCDAAED